MTIKRLKKWVPALIAMFGFGAVLAAESAAIDTTLADAIAAAEEGATITLADGTYTMPAMADKKITIAGGKGVVIDMSASVNVSGSTLTFDGVTLKFAHSSYIGFTHAAKIVYNKCALSDRQTLYAPVAVFTDCELTHNDSTSVWTYGANDVTFTRCTFQSGGRAVQVYNEATDGNFVANVTFADCKFYSDGTDSNKTEALVETNRNGTDTDTSNKYNLTFTNCSTELTNDDGRAFWGNKGNMDGDHLKVVIDGKTVYPVTLTISVGDTTYETIDAAVTAARQNSTAVEISSPATETLVIPAAATDVAVKVEVSSGTVAFDAAASTTAAGATLTIVKSSETVEGAAAVYEITLTKESGNVSDLNGTATVTLPVPAALDGKNVVVYFVADNGTKTAMENIVVADGKVSFTTTHFSTYSIEEGDNAVTESDWYGDGSATEFSIATAAELADFAAKVNSGVSFQGKTVTLMADIDLAGINWTPIGTAANPFHGTFDGDGKTISNLNVNDTELQYAGLFGYATDPVEIKNLTINNATVIAKSNVGALIGLFRTGKITNVDITGTVRIEGYYNVGGLMGYGYATKSDCHVLANGTITGVYKESNLEGDNVGGLVGHDGDSGIVTDGCSVIGTGGTLTISGGRKTGGLIGVLNAPNKVTNCKVDNVTVVCNATQEYMNAQSNSKGIGGLVGSVANSTSSTATLENCEVSNITLNVNALTGVQAGVVIGNLRTPANGEPTTIKVAVSGTNSGATAGAAMNASSADMFVAEVNGVKYETLSAAIAATADGQTVTLLCDCTISEMITIFENKHITIDGKGFTISRADGCIATTAVVKNPFDGTTLFYIVGELTIKNLTIDAKGSEGASIIGVTVMKGRLDMHDSVIKGGYADAGSALFIDGTVNMYGGSIEGNSTSAASTGGIIWVYDMDEIPDDSNAYFNMYSGKITGNIGGKTHQILRYHTNGYGYLNGEISGNSAQGLGGVLYHAGGGMNKVTFGPDLVIKNNTLTVGGETIPTGIYGGGFHNSTHRVNETVNETGLQTKAVPGSAPLTSAPLKEEMIFCVTDDAYNFITRRTLLSGTEDYQLTEEDLAKVKVYRIDTKSYEYTDIANDPTYELRIIDNRIELIGLVSITFSATDGEPATQTVKVGAGLPLNIGELVEVPTKSGYVFKAWYLSNGGYTFGADGTFHYTSDVTLTATWEEILPVAEVGGVKYETLQAAIDAAAAIQDDEVVTIQLLAGTFELGTVTFPAELTDVTFKGAENKATVLKNTLIRSADGNALNYQGITFDGIVFDNSQMVFTGWRTGAVTYGNWTITNCEFKNIDGTVGGSSNAAVHMNLDATSSMSGFTFTDNIIDGVTGSSASGLLVASVNGTVTITDNKFNNITHNAIQMGGNVGVGGAPATLKIENNIISNTGDRAIRLGNVTEVGTTVSITGNTFTDATDADGELMKATTIGTSTDVSVTIQNNTWTQGGVVKTADDIAKASINLVPEVVVTNWIQVADTAWYIGHEGDTEFTITTAAQLAGLAKLVNEGNTFEGKTIKLGGDIDLTGKEWTPIGLKEADKPFRGTFTGEKQDGTNGQISGLTITANPGDVTDDGVNNPEDYAALFGCIGTGAHIKNLTVGGTVSGVTSAAGIVARMNGGTIENCVNNVNVTGTGKSGGIVCLINTDVDGKIINCTNNGTILGGTGGTGGIVGLANMGNTVTGCVNNGGVGVGTEKWVGGIVGYSQQSGTVATKYTNCTNNGSLAGQTVGGIAGFGGSVNVIGCANTGIITGDKNGAIVGDVQSGSATAILVNNTTTTTGIPTYGSSEATSLVVGTGVSFDADGMVTSGIFEIEPPASAVAEGYEITDNTDGTFGVVPTETVVIVTSQAEIVEAFETASLSTTPVKIVLGNDITIENQSDPYQMWLGLDAGDATGIEATLDLAGFTLAANYPYNNSLVSDEYYTEIIYVHNDAKLTIVDSSNSGTGKIVAANGQSCVALQGIGAEVVVLSGTLECTGSGQDSYAIRMDAASLENPMDPTDVVNNQDLSATVSGGTVTGQEKAAIYVAGGNASLTVDGGVVASAETSPVAVGPVSETLPANGGDLITTGTTADININAGEVTGVGSVVEVVSALGSNLDDTDTTVDHVGVAKQEAATVTIYVAQVGTTKYETLQAAIDAANADEITLLGDIALTEGLTVAAGQTVVLDLNGYTVSYEATEAKASAAITNLGTLTITDSSEAQTGKITYKSTAPSASYAYSTSTIVNCGTLTVAGGTIENTTAYGSASYAIDNNSSGAAATVTVSDGTVVSSNDAIRMYANSDTYANTVNITGGVVTGYDVAVWTQLAGGKEQSPAANLNISGGTLNTVSGYAAVYSSSHGPAYDDITIDITGGTFSGSVTVGGYYGNYGGTGTETVTISGGTFNGEIKHQTPESNIAISGGSFVDAPAEEYIADGFEIVGDKTNGYGVQEKITNWIQVADTAWYNETDSAFTLFTAQQLSGLAKLVNEGKDTFAGKTVTLGGNIDLAQYEWTAIGTTANPFAGAVNGGIVNNLTITGASDNQGLFGVVSGAALQGLTLNNVQISGSEAVGGLIGYVTAGTTSIQNCKVNQVNLVASFAGGLIGHAEKGAQLIVTNNEVTDVVIRGAYVAGLVGYITGTPAQLKSCRVQNVDIYGDDYCVAGIVGGMEFNQTSTLEDCHVGGNIQLRGSGYVAGIIPYNCYCVKNIENCSVIGGEGTSSKIQAYYVNASTGYQVGGYIGGIVGWNPEGPYDVTDCTVKNITIEAGKRAGAIAGIIQYGSVLSNLTVENVAIVAHGDPATLSAGLIVGEKNATAATSPITIYNYTLTNVTLNDGTGPLISNINNANEMVEGCVFASATTPAFDESGKVTGGTFTMFDEAGAERILADGYTWFEDNGIYSIIRDTAEAVVSSSDGNVVGHDSLTDALTAAAENGGTVTILTNDVEWPGTIPEDVTIVLGENVTLNAPDGYKWNEEGTLVLKDYVAQITGANGNVIKCETFAEAKNGWAEGTTLKLLADISIGGMVVSSQNVTLDLNGYTLAGYDKQQVVAVTGSLTIKDSSEAQTGRVYHEGRADTSAAAIGVFVSGGILTLESGTIATYGKGNNCMGVYVNGATGTLNIQDGTVSGGLALYLKDGTINMSGGKVDAGYCAFYTFGGTSNISGGTITGTYGVSAYKGATVTVSDDAVITATQIGVTGNGSDTLATTINITGGTITGSIGVYHPQDGELIIEGGTIIGETGVEIRSGSLKISGDATSITGNGEWSEEGNDSGGTISGVGVAISQHTTNNPIDVEITGGTITGTKYAVYEVDLQDGEVTGVTASIVGGTFITSDESDEREAVKSVNKVIAVSVAEGVAAPVFNTPIDPELCADGFVPVAEPDENGMYTIKTGAYVAENSTTGVKYETLQDAIDAAGENNTVTLLADIELTQTVNIVDKTITLEGNGRTVSGKGVPVTSETLSNGIIGFNVDGGTVILQNMTLTGFDGVPTCNRGSVIQMGYSKATNLTVKNVNINLFARDAFSLYEGTFLIDGCEIDCTPAEGRTTVLTKGFQIGSASKATPVTGQIVDTKISNSNSSYEDWDASAIELYAGATVDVTGCEITNSPYGVYIDNYWGGMYDGYYTAGDTSVSISDTTIDNADFGVYIMSREGQTGKASVNIESGDYTGYVGWTLYYDAAGNGSYETSVNSVDFNVKGGTFSVPVPEDACAEGYIPTANEDGTYGVKLGSYVVRNTTTGVKYETLQAAVGEAEAGDTITLLANVTEEGVSISKALCVNLNTYAINGKRSLDGLCVEGMSAFQKFSQIVNGVSSEMDKFYVAETKAAPQAKVEVIANQTVTVDVNGTAMTLPLESTYKFIAPDADQAAANESQYGAWHADFVVSVDKDIPANSIVLAGNYGGYGWVSFTNPDPVAAGTKIRLLKTIGAASYDFPYMSYAELCSLVKKFSCGVADINDALNGVTFTVELKLFPIEPCTSANRSWNIEQEGVEPIVVATVDGEGNRVSTSYTLGASEMYTVTLRANAGGAVSFDGAEGTTCKVFRGDSVTIKATANAGYAFFGWSADNGSVWTSAAQELTPKGDMTIDATFVVGVLHTMMTNEVVEAYTNSNELVSVKDIMDPSLQNPAVQVGEVDGQRVADVGIRLMRATTLKDTDGKPNWTPVKEDEPEKAFWADDDATMIIRLKAEKDAEFFQFVPAK